MTQRGAAKMGELFFESGRWLSSGRTKKKTVRVSTKKREDSKWCTARNNTNHVGGKGGEKNAGFLQSGNAVLSFYTNKLIYLSTLYLKSYVQLLLYITVYIIKNLMKTYLQINES